MSNLHERMPAPASRAARRLPGIPGPWLGALLALVVAVPSMADGTYYVDANNAAANDNGPGTQAQPFKTITGAVKKRGGPYTTIFVKPAVYREQVTVDTSGTPIGPFAIRGLGSPVILDGSDDFGNNALWTVGSGQTWIASSVNWAPVQVFADGARLTASTATPDLMPVGTWQYVDGVGLYVNVGGGNPGSHGTQVSHRDNGLRVNFKSYIQLTGFTVRNTQSHGIYVLGGTNNVTVRSNVISFCGGHGIAAFGCTHLIIDSNIISYNLDHGINLLTGIQFSTIQDNECFHNARGFERAANGIVLFNSSSNVIQRNRLHDNEDSGMQYLSGSNNNIGIQNIAWNNGDHGFYHLASTGTLQIGDVAYGNAADGISIEGGSTGTQNFDCIMAENGLLTGRYDLNVDSSSVAGTESNYNIIWNSNASNPIRFNKTKYATVAAFTLATGLEAQTVQADPRFMNPATGDFHLQSGSPAIDSGDSGVPGWPQFDADQRDRVDDPFTLNLGAGAITFADRGALEYYRTGSTAVGDPVAAGVSLSGAYPNPGRGPVSFSLELAHAGVVDWSVVDVQGRLVFHETRSASAGVLTLRWGGLDTRGARLPAGIYLARARVNGTELSRRFAMVY